MDKGLIEQIVQKIHVEKYFENLDKIGMEVYELKFKKLFSDFSKSINESHQFNDVRKYGHRSSYINEVRIFDLEGIYEISLIEKHKVYEYKHRSSIKFDFRYREIKTNFLGFKIDEEEISVIFEPFYENYFTSSDKDYEKFKNSLDKNLIKINNRESELVNIFLSMSLTLLDEVVKESNTLRLKHSENIQNSLLEVDKDNNGEVDLVDDESFYLLLNKYQKNISDMDKVYIQKFVKISMYLKTKKKNTQKIFESINKTKNDKELNELFSLLKNQIHSYELMVFHSISMIVSLVENDYISFYEIYESFDQLGVFNSNWENEVSKKLTNINKGLKDIMYSLDEMESNIVGSLRTLNYTTQDSFRKLNSSISSQLGSINSSIDFNNLLTGIQTYQMYKVNQNTKRIN